MRGDMQNLSFLLYLISVQVDSLVLQNEPKAPPKTLSAM